MIATFEKPGANIVEEIWSCKIYYLLSECFLYDGNPYIEGIHELISDDMSYQEVYIMFHDKNFYDLWFDEFKDVYVAYREQAFSELRKKNVEVVEYLEDLDAGGVIPGTQLSSVFETRFPGKLTKKLNGEA